MDSNNFPPLEFHWWELATRIFGTLILSVLTPLTLNIFVSDNISALDQTFLGVLIFFSVSIVGLIVDVSRLRIERENELQEQFIEDDFDQILHNISESFRLINRTSRTENSLFTQYFKRRATELEEDMRRAAAQGELIADEKHVTTTDLLLQSLEGTDDDILRLVAFLDDLDFMYSTYQERYYNMIVEKIQNSEIQEVRRLLIYDERDSVSSAGEKLIKFHKNHPGYDCRLVSKTEFRRLCDDQRINNSYTDFGIYGPYYVYTAGTSNPDGEVIGTYHREKEKVNQYINLFDILWRQGSDPTEYNVEGKSMSVNELFEQAAAAHNDTSTQISE